MNFSLSVFDRIILLNVLPVNIDMMLYGSYHNFLQSLSFDELEYKYFGISVDEENQVHWKDNIDKDIYIPDSILDAVRAILRTCKEKELLQEEHMAVYNKFISED